MIDQQDLFVCLKHLLFEYRHNAVPFLPGLKVDDNFVEILVMAQVRIVLKRSQEFTLWCEVGEVRYLGSVVEDSGEDDDGNHVICLRILPSLEQLGKKACSVCTISASVTCSQHIRVNLWLTIKSLLIVPFSILIKIEHLLAKLQEQVGLCRLAAKDRLGCGRNVSARSLQMT